MESSSLELSGAPGMEPSSLGVSAPGMGPSSLGVEKLVAVTYSESHISHHHPLPEPSHHPVQHSVPGGTHANSTFLSSCSRPTVTGPRIWTYRAYDVFSFDSSRGCLFCLSKRQTGDESTKGKDFGRRARRQEAFVRRFPLDSSNLSQCLMNRDALKSSLMWLWLLLSLKCLTFKGPHS